VLPCVHVFVADEFCVSATILRTCLALSWGAQLEDVWTCVAFSLWTCVLVPNLRTCLALCWGAQLADVPCVAFGRPTCGRALCCIWAPILRMRFALHWGGQPWGGRIKKSTSKLKFVLIHPLSRLSAKCSLVWTFSLRIGFSFGHPSCRRVVRCVWAPVLRTRLFVLESSPGEQE
jgi:hypothetical protein